ncbi:hypothetical protein KCU65_g7028, partial [Aureobasidium melanogenum]
MELNRRQKFLPPDLLDAISSYLDFDSLLNFSLTNKQCNSAARRHVFHIITIKFSSAEELEVSVSKWHNILAHSTSFLYVQRVQVLPSKLWDPSYSLPDCGDHPIETWEYCNCDWDNTQFLADEAEWANLGHFLRKCPALQDLVWGCVELVPSSILDYINQKAFPKVRLHIENFRLNGIYKPPEVTIGLNPQELKVATSPCLHSLKMRYTNLDESGFVNYNEQAVIDMVAGAAPNLRRIHMFWQRGGSSPWHLLAFYKPKQPWRRDIHFPGSPTSSTGSLETLEIVSEDPSRSLMRWGEVTDFSKLRSLTVHSPIDVEALRWLTTRCRLSSLDNLALNVDYSDRDLPDEDTSNAMDDLLRSLRPLKSLKLVGLIEPRSISLAIEHHGRYLRRLLLYSTELLSEHHMQQGRADLATVPFLHELKENCPHLEELALRMIRSKGDVNEVATYRAIGEISSLRKIHLSVLCSEPLTWNTTVYEQFEAAYDDSADLDHQMEARLDDALINLAMDETLARSIFQVMSKAKPLHAPPLECLELRMNVLREWPTISQTTGVSTMYRTLVDLSS